jgi:DNA-binding NtrC family response regulator
MGARRLIVDDDTVSCQLFAKVLEGEGYHVDWVQTGENALSRLRNEAYDLLVIDVRMPEMTGLEVTRTVHEECPFLPVVVMTAFGSMETAIEAIHEGAFDYISKPMSLEELKHIVSRALAQRALPNSPEKRGKGIQESEPLGAQNRGTGRADEKHSADSR